MDDDQRGGVEGQAPPQHFPGIDRGVINRTYGKAFVRDEPVLAVEIEDMEALDITPNGQRAIVQNRLPCGQDRILVEMAQQDLARLVDNGLFLR